jgi:hypothetical protein
MFNFFKKIPKVEPKVGMKLEDSVWGRDYTEIEITRINKDKKYILYKFIRIKGKSITSSSEHNFEWERLIKNFYTPIVE